MNFYEVYREEIYFDEDVENLTVEEMKEVISYLRMKHIEFQCNTVWEQNE